MGHGLVDHLSENRHLLMEAGHRVLSLLVIEAGACVIELLESRGFLLDLRSQSLIKLLLEFLALLSHELH